MSESLVRVRDAVTDATPGQVPPFDGVRRRARSHTRRRVALGAAAVAGVTGAAVLTIPALWASSPAELAAEQTHYGPPPPTMTVEGVRVVLHKEIEADAVVLDAADRSVLVVHAGRELTGKPDSCRPYTHVRVLEESAAGLRLGVYRYVVAERPEDVGCSLEGFAPAQARVDLEAPLGSRRVHVGSATVNVHDPADVLRATTLPDGIRGGSTTFDPRTHVWTTVYDGPSPDHLLSVTQGAAPATAVPTSSKRMLGRPVVRGHQAELYDLVGTDSTCLVWAESDAVVVRVCATGPAPRLEQPDLVTTAEGLRAGASR